jgi:putative peptide zinc metalloprotease protein
VTPPLDPSPSSTLSPLPGGVGDGGPAVSSTLLVPDAGDAERRPPVPAPAAGVELFGETPGSGYREPPSLARRADGQTVQLSPLLYEVLRAIDGRRNYYEVADLVSERIGRTATAADVLFLAEAKLRPLGLLRNHDGSEPELPKANPLLALKCRLVITKPELTRRITQPFAALFRPTLVLLFVTAFLWSTWWVFFEQGLLSGFHQAFYEPHLLLLVFALTLVSAGFHEFGHAAACRYGGATPGAMGFGLYLIWPAFYTDVTDSYRLGRAGRLRVDLGGLYFNMIFAVGTFAAWAWLRADALLLLIFAQVLQMSRQLAPLVRFDGYHILADLIGVPDLFAHMKPTLLGLLPSRWRSGQHQALKPWARAAVVLWVLVVLPLLLLMLAMIVLYLPRLAATAWDSLGVQWEVLGQNWADAAWADVGIRVLSIVSLALPVLTVTYLIARVTRRTALWAWRASAGSPTKRAAAGFGAVALVAAVAIAWWPQGTFTPIDADEERGTLPELFSTLGRSPELVRAEAATPSTAAALVPAPVTATGTAAPPAPAPAPAPGHPVGPPELALVLVPAGSADAAAPVRRTATEVVRLDEVIPAEPTSEWPFPWRAPPPASEGDNRAMVVNTEDGSTVYDLAFAFVWVTDGDLVHHRNDAYAYASCRDCKSVAVAFQVILVIGYSEEYIPINTSEAGNFECESCTTHSLAVQLIATLREAPSDEVLAELGRVWAGLDLLEANVESLTIHEIYNWLRYVELQILTILANAGIDLDATSDDVALDEDGELQLDDALEADESDEVDGRDDVGDEGGTDVQDGDVTPDTDDPAVAEPQDTEAAGDDPDTAGSPGSGTSSSDPEGDDPSPLPTQSPAPSEDEDAPPAADADGDPTGPDPEGTTEPAADEGPTP